MLIDTQRIVMTATGGGFSDNTAIIRGIVKQVICKPHTETTTYNLSIVNPHGATVYERTSETGTLSELIEMPVNGIYTVTVLESTADEEFAIEIITRE